MTGANLSVKRIEKERKKCSHNTHTLTLADKNIVELISHDYYSITTEVYFICCGNIIFQTNINLRFGGDLSDVWCDLSACVRTYVRTVYLVQKSRVLWQSLTEHHLKNEGRRQQQQGMDEYCPENSKHIRPKMVLRPLKGIASIRSSDIEEVSVHASM